MVIPSKDELHYLFLKLHSLTGILPIGAFLVIHICVNSLRTVGVWPYQLSIDAINNPAFPADHRDNLYISPDPVSFGDGILCRAPCQNQCASLSVS